MPPTICFLCTGNAARSVMARAMFADRAPDYRSVGAGTLVIEGLPMSSRTRNAMAGLGLADPDHRSSQFVTADVSADLIVAMEPSHVAWILPTGRWPSVWPRWVWPPSRSGAGRRSSTPLPASRPTSMPAL